MSTTEMQRAPAVIKLPPAGRSACGTTHSPALPTVSGTPADTGPQFVKSKLAPRDSTRTTKWANAAVRTSPSCRSVSSIS